MKKLVLLGVIAGLAGCNMTVSRDEIALRDACLLGTPNACTQLEAQRVLSSGIYFERVKPTEQQ